MSIFARKICSPSLNSPSFIFWNNSKFSSTDLFLKGLFVPGSVGVPFCSRIASDDWLST